MSDASELRAGLDLLGELIGHRVEQETDKTVQQCLLWLRNRLLDKEFHLPFAAFALCFSRHGNSLSQWRSYSPHGAGVSLCFDAHRLLGLAKRAEWRWCPCVYDGPSQFHWMNGGLQEFINDINARIRRAELNSIDELAEDALRYRAHTLIWCAAHVKHKAFHQEEEIRVIWYRWPIEDAKMQYRMGKASLIPYIEFQLRDSEDEQMPLVDLIVGPTPQPKLSTSAVAQMQRSVRPEGTVAVSYCDIPYRQL